MDILDLMHRALDKTNDPDAILALDRGITEIERLREAMVEIVYLIGDRDRRQEVMDIAKPYAIQQLALKGNRPHVYLLNEEA